MGEQSPTEDILLEITQFQLDSCIDEHLGALSTTICACVLRERSQLGILRDRMLDKGEPYVVPWNTPLRTFNQVYHTTVDCILREMYRFNKRYTHKF